MQFGMPTLVETKNLTDCAQICKELGLDFIELNMNLPAYQADTLDIEQLNHIRKTQDIFFTIHLDENLNVCDFNRLVAEAYAETVLQTIETAKQISAPVLNMHMASGVYFTLPDRREYLFARYRDNYLSALSRFRQACTRAIGTSGIKLSIENTNGYPDFVKEGIDLLLESDAFALTLDTGHCHCAGGVDEAFILSHSDRLAHIHLHDASGKKDHLPLGAGDVPLQTYLALAKEHSCRIVLETKTISGLRKSIDALNGYLV